MFIASTPGDQYLIDNVEIIVAEVNLTQKCPKIMTLLRTRKKALTSQKSYFDIPALTRSVVTHLEKSIYLNYAFRHKSTLVVPKYFSQILVTFKIKNLATQNCAKD